MKNLFHVFQVLIFYGPRSNAELLLHSGFVFDDNAHDRLALRMGEHILVILSSLFFFSVLVNMCGLMSPAAL